MIEIIENSNIHTIDAQYFRPDLASIHLMVSKQRVAIIDTGTQHSLPQIKNALEQLGLNYSNVDYIILTHIHLDHAGGASALMDVCDNAQLVVHPRGASHMAQPEKLIAGTIAVYGEEKFKKMYGNISPIDETRIIASQDGQIIELAGRKLELIDSPGHANHHICIIDQQTNSVFTGDTLGVGYKALREGDDAFVVVTSSPVQFNPQAMHESIDRVMAYQPNYLYLTHYSAIKPNTRMIAALHQQIDDYVQITQKICGENGTDCEELLSKEICDYLVRSGENQFPSLDEKLIRDWVAMDAALNAQGLIVWYIRQQKQQ